MANSAQQKAASLAACYKPCWDLADFLNTLRMLAASTRMGLWMQGFSAGYWGYAQFGGFTQQGLVKADIYLLSLLEI